VAEAACCQSAVRGKAILLCPDHEEEVHVSLYTIKFMILLNTLVSRTVALTVTVIKHS
jgi:hypothetical protein